MSARPVPTRIYHITHLDNLPSIIEDGGILCDATMLARGGPATTVGMNSIKERRMGLPVKCHPGDCVGQYVPFYFCPRSIMLYLLHMGNHPELTYHGGQGPILHLEADLAATVEWAEASQVRWAFSLSNAGARYTEFRNSVDHLDDIDWAAVANNDFRSPDVKEGKQAEFLVKEFVPWQLIRRIGVFSAAIQDGARSAVAGTGHRPPIDVIRRWYF